MIKLNAPIDKQIIKKLKIGDEVLLSGTIFTARDRAYNYLLDNDFKKIRNAVIFHAGPIIKKQGDKILPISAGPTTSARFIERSIKLMAKYNIRVFIGKGGMDSPKMIQAMKKYGAVYLAAVGGAGVVYADKMKIKNIYQKNLGMTDSIWEIEVKDFPLIVAMDSRGNSIYHQIYKNSKRVVSAFLKE